MARNKVGSNQVQKKPVLDAVNDAVSALTDLVRSLRGNRSEGTDLKSRAKAVAREGKAGAREAKSDVRRTGADVRRAGHHLKSRFERAWDALTTSHGVASAAPKAKASRNGRKPASRRTPAPTKA